MTNLDKTYMATAAPHPLGTMRAMMNAPQFDGWRNRKVRRRLVAVNAILGAALIAVLAALHATGALWWIAAVGLILPCWVVVTGYLNASIRGLTELKGGDLDERERPLRDRVYARLWWPAIVIAYAPALALILAKTPLEIAVPVLLGCYFVTLGLPVYWLAWTLPDEPAAD
jgi:hypothetical protein